MIVKISFGTWRDVFDFLHPTKDRRHMALISGIGGRELSNICQQWLHEWTRNVCLRPIRIFTQPTMKIQTCLFHRLAMMTSNIEPVCLESKDPNDRLWKQAPFAEVELPENIRDFQMVEISYLNTTVIDFLRRLQSLFRNINLYVKSSCECGDTQTVTETVLGHVLPLVNGGIDTVTLDASQLLYTIRERFPAHFLSIKRLRIWMLKSDITIELVYLLLHWLGTRRTDGEHRTLILWDFFPDPSQFIARIRQHFFEAITPASYFVWIRTGAGTFAAIQESVTKNDGTNEQLLVRKPESDTLIIGRCPSGMNGEEWVEELDNQIFEEVGQTAPRIITVSHPILGQMEEPKSEEKEEEIEEEEDDVDQQPGPSSKKRKLF